MSEVLSAEVAVLRAASGEIHGLCEEYESRLKVVESSMSSVFGVGWVGAAQRAFEVEWDSWHARALDLARLLARTSSDIDAYTSGLVSQVEESAACVDSGFHSIDDVVQW